MKERYHIKVVTRSKQTFEADTDELFNYEEFKFNSEEPFVITGNPSFYINPMLTESITVFDNEYQKKETICKQ